MKSLLTMILLFAAGVACIMHKSSVGLVIGLLFLFAAYWMFKLAMVAVREWWRER